MPLSDDARREFAGILKQKRAQAAQDLEKVLSGQNLTLGEILLPHETEGGLTPLEKARRYLQVMGDAYERSKTPAYGLCAKCGAELSETELRGMPWADRCRACARLRE